MPRENPDNSASAGSALNCTKRGLFFTLEKPIQLCLSGLKRTYLARKIQWNRILSHVGRKKKVILFVHLVSELFFQHIDKAFYPSASFFCVCVFLS